MSRNGNAVELLNLMLLNSTLDTFEISSLVINLKFLTQADVADLVSVNLSGRVRVALEELVTEPNSDFFKERELQIPRLYRLIGRTVKAVSILDQNELSIRFEHGAEVSCATDDFNLEEIWSVSSRGTYVALDDAGQIGIKLD